MANVGQQARAKPVTPGVSPFMGWLPRKLWVRAKDFFVYSAQFLPLGAGATSTFETAIQSDSDFVIIAGVRFVDDAASPPLVVASPVMLVRIVDTGSGRELFDRAQHIENIFGTGQLPSYWPMPKIIRASSTIQTIVQNLHASAARNVRIAYLGFKVFGYTAD